MKIENFNSWKTAGIAGINSFAENVIVVGLNEFVFCFTTLVFLLHTSLIELMFVFITITHSRYLPMQ